MVSSPSPVCGTLWNVTVLVRYSLGMRMRTIVALVLFVGVGTFAQQTTAPQLKLRIIADRDAYFVGEKVFVKTELMNLTSKTLCFPVPDRACSTTATGWIVTKAQPVMSTREIDQFICHADSRIKMGAELASEIRNRWIKLPPNAAYVTGTTEAKIELSEGGAWRLTASYHPPVASFGAEYKRVLQSQKAGCELPDSGVVAEPKLISVRPVDAPGW